MYVISRMQDTHNILKIVLLKSTSIMRPLHVDVRCQTGKLLRPLLRINITEIQVSKRDRILC